MYRVLYKNFLVVFNMSICYAMCLTPVCLFITLIMTIIIIKIADRQNLFKMTPTIASMFI